MCVIASVDLGGTNIKAALFSVDGELLVKNSWPTEAEKGYQHVLENIVSIIRQLSDERQVSFEDIQGVGIGVPALMSERGRYVVMAPNLRWSNKELVKDLRALLTKPVYAHNDANLAALGEWWQGSGKGMENLLMVTIGTGIGSGLILDGKLYTGASGMGVEIGHMVVDISETNLCSCGRRGCLETYTAAPAVIDEALRLLGKGEQSSLLSTSRITAKDIYQAASSKDPIAEKVVNRAAFYLGTALANVLNLLDLNAVIIGGGVSNAGDTLLNPLKEVIKEEVLFFDRRPTKIIRSLLGNEAGMYGAALWVLSEGGVELEGHL